MKSFREFIVEGGNVFAGKTSSIKIDHIKPTLDSYFAELSKLFPKKKKIFNTKYFIPLGSVGKKPVSGDIDLGVDSKVLVDSGITDKSIAEWGLDPKKVHDEYVALEKRAKTATPEMLMMKAFLKELTKHINSHAPNLFCDEKKVTQGNIFGLYPQLDTKGKKLGTGVQIDWMVGDLKWLKFSYYSSAYPVTSNVKGLHRTQLLLSAFQVANLLFNHVNGVKDKATGDIIAKNPKDALNVLNERLGTKVTDAIAENYYELHKHFKAKMKKDDYNQMVDTYLKILDSTRADIPDDLQDEWKKRKSKLGLTGKFLPDNSLLKGEV